MLDTDELSRRWGRVTGVMDALDLDVLVAIDWSRDEIHLSWQRWLTGFAPIGMPAAALVFRDGHVELFTRFLARVAPAFYAATGLPIVTAGDFSDALFAERIAGVGARRVGYAEAGAFPASLYQALQALPQPPEVVDVSADLIRLRAQKSEREQAAVRQSCAIADKVWSRVPDIFGVGRKQYEILADVDHLARLEGAEGGFYLLSRLPFMGMSMQVMADPEEILPDTRYLLEVSPRYDGYYSQLTSPVSTIVGDDMAMKPYNDIVDAKAFAQPLMKPGADLSQIAVQVERFLAGRGNVMPSRSLGHFCGMALEEPRHDPGRPCVLEAGMTFIFHPVLTSPELNSLMRADTYLITGQGAERLNRYQTKMLQLG